MQFSKDEMQKEFLGFLSTFGHQVARLYGAGDNAWTEEDAIRHAPLWECVSEMYDYGISGIPTKDLGPGIRIDGLPAHAEMFLRAIDTPSMRIYLEECDIAPPRLAMLAVRSAVARTVLDGAERYTDYAAGEQGIGNGDWGYLTLAEVALLANMDERSVRNAANPKLPDPLKTESVGKRSLVTPEEARRWLAGRKSFVATQETEPRVLDRRPEFDLELSKELVELIEREAKETGRSFNACLKEKIFKAYEEIQKEEGRK